MHELSVAMALHRACLQECPQGGLELVQVRVGELSGVEPDLLEFAWSACIAETRDAGAILEIEFCQASQVCDRCGPVNEKQPGSWLRLCPYCESPLRVQGGDELEITAITTKVAPRMEQEA